MTRRRPPQGGRSPDDMAADMAAEVDALYHSAAQRLRDLIDRLDAGEMAAAGELPSAAPILHKAMLAVLHEREKLERIGRADPDGEFDLAAARAEVRRRLDRLRAAEGAEEAAGGADRGPPRARCPGCSRSGRCRTSCPRQGHGGSGSAWADAARARQGRGRNGSAPWSRGRAPASPAARAGWR